MSTTSKGSAGERAVRSELQGKGWTVGCRRHIGGCGDVLAVKAGYRPRLIEVKATKRSAPSVVTPAERREFSEYAKTHDLHPQIAWVQGQTVTYFDEVDWPK